MRLLSLNCWGGQQGDIFFDYISSETSRTDIFCFQEIYRSSAPGTEYKRCRTHLFEELQSILKGHTAYFSLLRSQLCNGEPVDFNVEYGLAAFVSGRMELEEAETIPIVPQSMSPDDGRALQHLRFGGKAPFSVFNFHGLSLPGEKLDTPERLMQSGLVAKALVEKPGPKILCGDFNLMPDTQSVRLLEEGMVNLIKTFDIKNTRNEISWQFYNNRQYFADYTFVSPEVKVKNFEVPYNLASDHLPMVLEFELQ